MPRTGILLIGHGSRDQASNHEFEELVEHLRRHRPDFDVRHAYVELAKPSLADRLAAIAVGNDRVVVVPCFLFTASHLKNDLPLALATARSRFPGTQAPSGDIHARVREAGLKSQSTIIVGRVLTSTDFAESRLYAPDRSHRFRKAKGTRIVAERE